jgi:hypothetical protein
MNHDDDQGLFYFVSDEMLRRFAKSTVAQRLQWLDEMRTFTWNAQTDATRARWRAEREARHGRVSAPANAVEVNEGERAAAARPGERRTS